MWCQCTRRRRSAATGGADVLLLRGSLLGYTLRGIQIEHNDVDAARCFFDKYVCHVMT